MLKYSTKVRRQNVPCRIAGIAHGVAANYRQHFRGGDTKLSGANKETSDTHREVAVLS